MQTGCKQGVWHCGCDGVVAISFVWW